MRSILCYPRLWLILVLLLSGCSGKNKDDKITTSDPEWERQRDEKVAKLTGLWELTKSESGDPAGATMRFDKNGQFQLELKIGGSTLNSAKGTFNLEGDAIKCYVTLDSGKKVAMEMTLKSVTDKTLVVIEKNGKSSEYTRK